MYKPLVHYDKDLEAAVVGACLLEKFTYAEVRGILFKDCFYYPQHKIIYEAIEKMWSISFPIDMLTVASYIVRNMGIEEVEGNSIPIILVEITKSVCLGAHIQAHAFILRQLYAERELLRIKQTDDDTSVDIVSRTKQIQEEMFRLTQIKVTNDWKDISEVVVELSAHMDEVKDKSIVGIPTGFSKFDLVTSGFGAGQMIILAARPSVGKSAFLGTCAVNAATKGFKVGIVSLEMSNVEIAARFGSLVADEEFYKIFRNKFHADSERDAVMQKLSDMGGLPIKISDKTNVSINDVRAKVEQLKHREGIDILFVDYLQLLESDDSNRSYNREQEVAKMSRGFKLLAKEFKIPVVVLAQLNRESEKLANKKPQLHHLRESGSIEQDADGVVFLHRDWKSGIEANPDGSSTEHEADLIIAKWRNGELKEIKIGFDGGKMKFFDKQSQQSSGWNF